MGIVEPFDVSAPLREIGPLVSELRARLAEELPGSRPVFFGHIADGNLHLALELADEAQRGPAEALVYGAVRAVGGSVSAEHGIGMLKRDWLAHSRSAEEIALMRTIRGALDPRQILNPQRIF
jgi:FAD/FMN-containing dehydrogenase